MGDVDRNGHQDVLLLSGDSPPRLFMADGRGGYGQDPSFQPNLTGIEGAVGGQFGDFDLDGDLDLVLLAATHKTEEVGHYLLINNGAGPVRESDAGKDLTETYIGRFHPPVRFAEQPKLPVTRGAVAADLDGDGTLEVLVGRVGDCPELWRLADPPNRRWLEVAPVKTTEGPVATRRPEPSVIGMQIEIKAGPNLQTAAVQSSSGYLGCPPPRAHFGLGDHGKCDYVRLTWPDAVFQSELEVPADQHWEIAKVTRKPSSCPLLFSWDGERFAFVTDILGVGGLGFFVAPDQYAPPDPTEAIRIPAELIEPCGGRYLLRIAEPLEEAVYLDELHLVVYDHPSIWQIYANERFSYSSAPSRWAPDCRRGKDSACGRTRP